MHTIKFSYEGPVDAFRNVMISLRGWRPSTGERVVFSPAARARHDRYASDPQTPLLSVFFVSVTDDDTSDPLREPKRAATLTAYKITDDQLTTTVELRDGSFAGPKPREPLGPIRDELLNAIIERLMEGGIKIVVEPTPQAPGTPHLVPGPVQPVAVDLPDLDRARQIYPDYAPATARDILEKLPKLYEDYEKGLMDGKWGPTLIGKHIGLTPSTVSRYMRVFRETGIEIRGVPIPGQAAE